MPELQEVLRIMQFYGSTSRRLQTLNSELFTCPREQQDDYRLTLYAARLSTTQQKIQIHGPDSGTFNALCAYHGVREPGDSTRLVNLARAYLTR
jgi:hypothetical protein